MIVWGTRELKVVHERQLRNELKKHIQMNRKLDTMKDLKQKQKSYYTKTLN